MAVQRGVMVPSKVVVVVVALSFLVAACCAQLPTGCPPVDRRGDNATLFANPNDCSTFYICSQGKPVLLECPKGLLFNDATKTCDYAYNVKCVAPEPTPAPEQAEVATTKVVVTKIVKEVFKPADDSVASVTIKNDVVEPEVQPITAEPAVVDADVSLDNGLSEPVATKNDVVEPEVQPITAKPAIVDADVSLDDGLSEPVATIDDSQSPVVNADASVSDLKQLRSQL
uniref:Salivary mucin n=1 Tax=Amblyomma variegatum TaxID=34610 RepID=F0JA38_AMBVA|nr:TPA_inf: salivary mucin [Amblyomma variegatum]